MDISETKQVQESPKLVQDLMQLPAWAVMCAAFLGVAAFGIMPFWAAITGCLFVLVTKRIEAAKYAEKVAMAQAATYANCIGPVVVSSIRPDETLDELQDRAAHWKEQLKLSGNPYAERIPVVVIPYNVVLTEHNQLTAGWSIYQKQVAERQHIENLGWYERGCPNELKALFASAVLPAPKQDQI